MPTHTKRIYTPNPGNSHGESNHRPLYLANLYFQCVVITCYCLVNRMLGARLFSKLYLESVSAFSVKPVFSLLGKMDTPINLTLLKILYCVCWWYETETSATVPLCKFGTSLKIGICMRVCLLCFSLDPHQWGYTFSSHSPCVLMHSKIVSDNQ